LLHCDHFGKSAFGSHFFVLLVAGFVDFGGKSELFEEVVVFVVGDVFAVVFVVGAVVVFAVVLAVVFVVGDVVFAVVVGDVAVFAVVVFAVVLVVGVVVFAVVVGEVAVFAVVVFAVVGVVVFAVVVGDVAVFAVVFVAGSCVVFAVVVGEVAVLAVVFVVGDVLVVGAVFVVGGAVFVATLFVPVFGAVFGRVVPLVVSAVVSPESVESVASLLSPVSLAFAPVVSVESLPVPAWPPLLGVPVASDFFVSCLFDFEVFALGVAGFLPPDIANTSTTIRTTTAPAAIARLRFDESSFVTMPGFASLSVFHGLAAAVGYVVGAIAARRAADASSRSSEGTRPAARGYIGTGVGSPVGIGVAKSRAGAVATMGGFGSPSIDATPGSGRCGLGATPGSGRPGLLERSPAASASAASGMTLGGGGRAGALSRVLPPAGAIAPESFALEAPAGAERVAPCAAAFAAASAFAIAAAASMPLGSGATDVGP
jgi:hypothetical protein